MKSKMFMQQTMTKSEKRETNLYHLPYYENYLLAQRTRLRERVEIEIANNRAAIPNFNECCILKVKTKRYNQKKNFFVNHPQRHNVHIIGWSGARRNHTTMKWHISSRVFFFFFSELRTQQETSQHNARSQWTTLKWKWGIFKVSEWRILQYFLL